MAFYDIFESLCKERGVTPTQVARENGIQQSVVAMWKKRGSTPKAETVQKLADYFDVNPGELMGLEQVDKYLWANKTKPKNVQDVTIHEISLMPDGRYSVAFSLEPDKISVSTLKKIIETCHEIGISTDDLKRSLEAGSTMADFISELSKVILDINLHDITALETTP